MVQNSFFLYFGKTCLSPPPLQVSLACAAVWLLQVAAEADPEADPFYGVLGLGHGGYLGYPGYPGYPVYRGYPGYPGYPGYLGDSGYLGGHLGYLQHLAAGPPHSYLQPSFHTSAHHPPAVAPPVSPAVAPAVAPAVSPAVAPAVAAVEPAGAARIAGLGAVPAVPHSVAARPDTSLHTPAAAPPVAAPPVAAVSAVAAASAPAGYIEGVAGRVTSRQYHAQDEEGNYSFGYSNPSSARAEAGNPRTGVQG